MKYSPAPWTLEECSNGGLILRRGNAQGKTYHPQSHLQIVPEDDARLIAAAPDMYEALKEATQNFKHEEFPTVSKMIKEAIAKAEGR